MDLAEIDRSHDDVKGRSVVIRIDAEEGVSAMRPEQDADRVLRCLTPLINSMRLFGFYFTHTPRVDPVYPTSQQDHRARGQDHRVRGCRDWSGARVYATVMLVVTWINAARKCVIFDGTETIGARLFTKLGMIPGSLHIAVLHTTYYVASHTGSLNTVFRQLDSLTPDCHKKYNRRARVVTIISWILAALGFVHYIEIMLTKDHFYDLSLALIVKTFRLSKQYVNILSVLNTIMEMPAIAVWSFTQAMNYIVMSFLYDRFDQLNNQFVECIGSGGQFSGDIEEFRRRHQSVSRSVEEADRFLMISNVACFCCQIVTIILIFYSTVFFRDDTMSMDPRLAAVYIGWLIASMLSLSLTAGQAVILNHTVNILY